jgi:hypothetical protein
MTCCPLSAELRKCSLICCAVIVFASMSTLGKFVNTRLQDFSATQTVCLTVGRDSPRASEIGETPILKGAIALACQWAIRRCDLYFPNPTRFGPDRTFHGRQLVRRINVLTSGFEISGDVQKYKAQTYTANEIEPRIGALG